MKLDQFVEDKLPSIEDELRACMAAPGDGTPAFFGMMHYHLGWTDEEFQPVQARAGKRLRPLLTMLACQAAGGDPDQALPAAAALEILHNFTLIHDDIEDDSPTRRGRRTVWNIWGEPQAINAGDAMFALAHLALHRLTLRGLSPDRLVTAFQCVDQTTLALTRGQHLDMAFEEDLDVDVETYMQMIRGKTAALLACCAHLGALVAGSETETAEHYRIFGHKLGMAFQIQDDVLGIWGDSQVTGKPVADDIRSRKKTLPVLAVMNGPATAGSARLRELYTQDQWSEAQVPEAIAILDTAGARSQAEFLAGQYLDQALAELEQAGPEPEAEEALREMALFFVKRRY